VKIKESEKYCFLKIYFHFFLSSSSLPTPLFLPSASLPLPPLLSSLLLPSFSLPLPPVGETLIPGHLVWGTVDFARSLFRGLGV